MSLATINQALAEFSPDDKTPRLVEALFKVIPEAPRFVAWKNLMQATQTLKQGMNDADLNRARAAAQDPSLEDVLWMANLIDSADKGYAVFTGIASAYKLATGQKGAAEFDEEQRNDAVAKALALAYMGYKAYPGGIKEKAQAMTTYPSGRALLQYYVAAEICLPFADNVVTSGGKFVGSMLSGGAPRQLQRLTSMAGGRSMEGVGEMLSGMTDHLQRLAETTSRHAKPIADTVGKYAGGVLAAADVATGLAATAADVMPVYRFLGGRLAAEGAVVRAFGKLP